ncbi:F box only protein 8 [Paragonimus heterotremus]|uniref:F box only protein 8 n=2 Tax=Paragonimus TaxID=34503 RepID=A0A8J4SIR8_9TREM|nr:F box only protein 8 [Paragonimus heterotremus]
MGQFLSIISSTENRVQSAYVARSGLSDRRLNRRFDPTPYSPKQNTWHFCRSKFTAQGTSLKRSLKLECYGSLLSSLRLARSGFRRPSLAAVCLMLYCSSNFRLCHRTWSFCSIYEKGLPPEWTYKQLYLRLDEARLTFNADAFEGMRYMLKFDLLSDDFDDLVAFFHTAVGLDPVQKRRFLLTRPLVFDRLINLKDFKGHFLPNALRRLFEEFPAPLTDSSPLDFVSLLVSKFSDRYVRCNPSLGMSKDEVYMLCFSLIMLSVDLWCPHVKNKMSKREFIRNTRHVTRAASDEYLGGLYDNVYMVGHVVLGHLAGPLIRHPDIRNALT